MYLKTTLPRSLRPSKRPLRRTICFARKNVSCKGRLPLAVVGQMLVLVVAHAQICIVLPCHRCVCAHHTACRPLTLLTRDNKRLLTTKRDQTCIHPSHNPSRPPTVIYPARKSVDTSRMPRRECQADLFRRAGERDATRAGQRASRVPSDCSCPYLSRLMRDFRHRTGALCIAQIVYNRTARCVPRQVGVEWLKHSAYVHSTRTGDFPTIEPIRALST